MGKSSLLIWCGNLILQKDLHHVYLILRNLLYLIQYLCYYSQLQKNSKRGVDKLLTVVVSLFTTIMLFVFVTKMQA